MSELKPHTAGYMKPPEHSRFRKGKSGNPKGRPPRESDPFTVLRKVLARRISVAGGDKKMTIEDALLWRLRERAIAGERRAIELQQRIFTLAGKANPPEDVRSDSTAAKQMLAEMMGIRVEGDEPAGDSRA